MKKWDYADESTFAFNIAALILGLPITIAFVMERQYVIALSFLIVISLILLPFYIVIYIKRGKRRQIEKHCDYKTYGQIVGSEMRKRKRRSMNHARHLVVVYRDASDNCCRFTTPAVNTHLRDYTILDGLMCDVYIKGDEVLARNIREDTVFSKLSAEEIERRKKRKKLIKIYQVGQCFCMTMLVLWFFVCGFLASKISNTNVLSVMILIGLIGFGLLYGICSSKIGGLKRGDEEQRTK